MSTKAHTSNSSRASTRILIGFVAIALGMYFGYKLWANRAVPDRAFPPLTPSRVNLVGIDTTQGFRIIVANGVAQVVERPVGEADGDNDPAEAEAEDEGAARKRVPIKEMLQSMQGNEEAIGRFAMILNEIREDELPPRPVYWTVDDLDKALSGDAALRAKLEADLNTKLDGTPLPLFRPSTLNRGIVIKAPVTLKVPTAGGHKSVQGAVPLAYETRFMQSVYERVSRKPDVTNEMLKGYYTEEARKVVEGERPKENVVQSIRALIADEALHSLADLPQRVLNGSTIVATDAQIEDARSEPYEAAQERLYRIELRMSEEGRQRLWQYSRGKVGRYLLLIVDGVAVAAPRIEHELAQRDLTITQVREETLAKEAVEGIQEARQAKA